MDLHISSVPVGALEAQMLEKLISLCSRLQKLTLCILGKMINFTICAPELQDLVVKDIMSSLSLKATGNIKTIGVDALGEDLESLQTLKLLEVPLNCNYAVPFILCLFRSSPHLQRLCINASSFEKCSGKSVQNKGNFTLPCLKYVEFAFKASVELELIKILLASCPALEVMTIVLSETFTAENKLEVAKELMQYDRASPNVEIILKP
uniref:FBD domain-containing protein n=2 Tax=Chenopodium quinoa TaxID=63459 RepID=A0A803KVE2_CHEQI